jgi:hypothetical protein
MWPLLGPPAVSHRNAGRWRLQRFSEWLTWRLVGAAIAGGGGPMARASRLAGAAVAHKELPTVVVASIPRIAPGSMGRGSL